MQVLLDGSWSNFDHIKFDSDPITTKNIKNLDIPVYLLPSCILNRKLHFKLKRFNNGKLLNNKILWNNVKFLFTLLLFFDNHFIITLGIY